MAADEIAIKVDKVYKDFTLPHLRKNTVKSYFTGIFDKASKQGNTEVQHALKDISFEIKKGEFFGIVGRNGSGKSTLLKILAGIYQPTQGSVGVAGKLVPFIELGVGFNPELTGRENVYLNGALLGFDHKKIDEMYDDIVGFAELERFMDQKLKNYSSGMQVRLAFSMAIRAEADILLIDEVLAVGDAEFQRKCFDYFKRLKKDKKTVVFVSHDMSAVREYCDKAVLIDKNKIIETGDPASVSKSYTKMFIDEYSDKTEEEQSKTKRRGDNKVSYSNVKTSSVVKEAKHILIEAEVTAKESIDSLNLGFEIKSSNGSTLVGTNTVLSQNKLYSLDKGQKATVKWKVPNIFEDGLYTIDLAVVYDGSKIADWWEDALSFRSLRANKTPFQISPFVDVEVSKLNLKGKAS